MSLEFVSLEFAMMRPFDPARDFLPLIYNPTAGGAGASAERKARSAAREMEKLGASIELLPTGGPGTARDLAAGAVSRGAPRIVVAGGDGTINEVINGLAPGETELALIPAGTANVLALELAVPFNVRDAARIAVRGRAAPVDLGLAGDHAFALMAGVGFDALAIKNLNPVLKKTIRHAAFPISGIKTFMKEELPRLRVSGPPGCACDGYFVVVANSRFYGGHLGPTPEASITDGLLDVCVLKENTFAGMANFWLRALASSTLDEKHAEYFRVPAVSVTAPGGEQVLVQTDGELSGELPMEFRAVAGGLRVCRGNL